MEGRQDLRSIIGRKVKAMRTEMDLTLRELAGKAKLSASFLARLENGKITPSLESLQGLSEVFGRPITYFFGEEDSKPHYQVTRQNQASYSVGNGAESHSLTRTLFGAPRMDISVVKIKPGAVYEKEHSHMGEEVLYILDGEVEVQLNDKKEVLKKGEAINLDCRQRHSVLNIGTDEARLILAVTPPNPRPSG